jgi:replication factor C subunit 1
VLFTIPQLARIFRDLKLNSSMDIRNFFGKKQSTAFKSNAKANETKTNVKKKPVVEVQKNEGLKSDSDATTDMPLHHDIRNSSQSKSESSLKGTINVEDLDGEETDFSESSPTVQNKRKLKTETALGKRDIIDSKGSNNHHRVEQKKAKASGKRIIQEDSESDDDYIESSKATGKKRKSRLSRNKEITYEEDSEESAILPSPKKRMANTTRKHISETENDDDTDGDFSLAAKTIQRKSNLMENPNLSESEDTSDEEFNSPKRKITAKKVTKQMKAVKSEDLVHAKRKTVPSSKGSSRRKPSANKKNDAEDDGSTTISQKSSPKPKPRKKDTSSPKQNNKPILLEPTTSMSSFSSEQAAPECLSGLTFVFSGILDTLGRDESIDYVKILGGRVTTAVSRKTSYLVVGSTLEDGRPVTEGSKYQKASELGIRIVEDESKFFGLCKLYSDQVTMRRGDDCNLDPTESSDHAKQINPDCETQTSVSELQPTPTKASVNPYAKKSNPYAKVNPYASKKASTSGAADAALVSSKGRGSGEPNDLWVDKYAPTSTHDILGNQESVKKLTVCKFYLSYRKVDMTCRLSHILLLL